MKQLQTAGGIAALCLSGLFVGLLYLLAVALPGQGLGPHTLDDPAIGIPFVATSSLPGIIALVYIGTALVFVPIMLALYQRLQAAAPALLQVVVVAGLVASGLFLAYGMITMVGNPTVVSAYQHDAARGGAVYLALRLTGNAMNAGALFALGWAIALVSWVTLRAGGLPKVLSAIMLLAGITLIVSFVLLSVGLIGVLLAPIWSAWLGVVLLRAPAKVIDSRRQAVVAGA
jgi:hypothetical protein